MEKASQPRKQPVQKAERWKGLVWGSRALTPLEALRVLAIIPHHQPRPGLRLRPWWAGDTDHRLLQVRTQAAKGFLCGIQERPGRGWGFGSRPGSAGAGLMEAGRKQVRASQLGLAQKSL